VNPKASFAAGGTLRDWLKALRLHQWAKNLLVFVPLLLSGELMTPGLVLRDLAAVALLGLCASGAYLFNDVSDLEADRAHPLKRLRPFAAGRISPRAGRVAGVTLIAAGLGGAAVAYPQIAGWLALYLVGTLSYSFVLKSQALVDVAVLAALYVLRLVIGAAQAGVPLSEWLAVFASTFFLSLSIAKRHAEIMRMARDAPGPIPRRGYRTDDMAYTLVLGVASATTAFLVMVLFIVLQAMKQANYARPEFLWAVPFVLLFWIARVWLLASRGELHEDPVVFALRDRTSLALGGLALAAVLVAVYDRA
jgi:4-hydroxybenzoate polyprenyltransferase